MKVITGTVIDESGFHLTADEEEELAAALDDIRAGSFQDGRELLAELKGLSSHRDNAPRV
jgi:hypothetical protein